MEDGARRFMDVIGDYYWKREAHSVETPLKHGSGGGGGGSSVGLPSGASIFTCP